MLENIPALTHAENIVRECHACGKPHSQHESFSFVLSYIEFDAAKGVAGESCTPGDLGNHWGCSHYCAVNAAHTCVDDHDVPAYDKWIPSVGPFKSGVAHPTCAACLVDISSHAYHISPTYATPGLGYGSFHYTEMSDGQEYWSCSWKHAETVAHAIIQELLEKGEHG